CGKDDCCADEHDHDHADESHVVGFRGFARSFYHWLSRRAADSSPSVDETAYSHEHAAELDHEHDHDHGHQHAPARPRVAHFPDLLRRIWRHAFIEMADDIVFWLVIGFILAGVISALVPADLADRGLGSGLLPMLILLAAGVPMYMCASASTPVAAALVAKGVSPGAALVFLLSGPATNAATIVLLTKHFGRGFVRIYIASIVVTSLAAGLFLDWLLGVTGWRVVAKLSAEGGGIIGVMQWILALALVALILWRFKAGALKQGLADGRRNLEGLIGLSPETNADIRAAVFAKWRGRTVRGAAGLALAAYMLSGFYVVPPDSAGYVFLFDKLVKKDVPPGLHFAPPAPIGRADVWRVGYPRKTDIGFRTDLTLLAGRRNLAQSQPPGEWHSPVAAMNTVPSETAYVTGDENLLEMSFTVHYALSDPEAFFYRVTKDADLVSLYAQTAASQFIARHKLDTLLTEQRTDIETHIAKELQASLDHLKAGVRILSVHVVDLHPPQDAVFAFRNVSSAREDKETKIHRAWEEHARRIPLAEGKAAAEIARAQGIADAKRIEAQGKAEGFTKKAAGYALARDILRHLLWLETAEKVLTGKRKYIVPKGADAPGLSLWDAASPLPAAPGDRP
ncbi:permease, partial [bacterium]|nr:permease [bacterium]